MFPAPPGIRLLQRVLPSANPTTRPARYKAWVVSATFLAYMCFHMTRRPISIVKAVLNHEGSCAGVPPIVNVTVTDENKDTWCDWDPFTGKAANLGYLDSVYLFSYAICMFFSGWLAERMHLRYFLSTGMLLSGLTTYIFGLGYSLNIHSLWFFMIVQIFAGGVQSTGWPAVVTCMSNWFGKEKRGLIFGIWNAHTSIGNILGALIAGAFVNYNWGMSFYVPGMICAAMGLMIFIFLPPNPEEVRCADPNSDVIEDRESRVDDSLRTVPGTRSVPANLSDDQIVHERTPLLKKSISTCDKEAISFFKALAIPGVVEFSLALFFAKLVAYTFLFWLPLYLNSSTHSGAQESANLSTLFDIGGILGGIVAGYASDRTGASATTSVIFLAAAIPMLFIYRTYGALTKVLNITLLFITGFLVNGPYALITTAVSAELGNHPTVSSGSNAMATVTAIIDGTGSIGAAIGPLLADVLKNYGSNWLGVFVMVMVADLLALICLLRISYNEIMRIRGSHNQEAEPSISSE